MQSFKTLHFKCFSLGSPKQPLGKDLCTCFIKEVLPSKPSEGLQGEGQREEVKEEDMGAISGKVSQRVTLT